MKSLLVVTVGFALGAAPLTAQTAGKAGSAAKASAGSSLASAFAKMAREYEAAANRGDAAAVAALYTEDALLMPSNTTAVNGRAAIQEFFKGMFAQGVRNVKFGQVAVVGSGSNGYEAGTYEFDIGPAGAPAVHDKGKYIVGLRRAANGRWLIAHDIFNSDMPCPPAPATR